MDAGSGLGGRVLRRLGGMRSALALVTAAFAAAACSDATGPGGLDIEIVSGSQQRGLGGWQLEETLVVRVTDQSGAPSAGVSVRFAVTAGGGTTSPTTVTTDALGGARTRWTLGAESNGTQIVTASVGDGSVSVTFEATELMQDEADVVVVHGALAPLLGLVVARDGSTFEVLGLAPTADTVIHIPPADAGDRDIVVFGLGNRPLLASPSWTGGVDTAHVTLRPPVAVDLDFYVLSGALADQQAIMEDQIAALDDVWLDEGMGLTVGQVTYIDIRTSGLEINLSSSGICSGLTRGEAVRIDLVESIDSGSFTGWGCRSGHVFLAEGTDRFPYLLAHELGHTFTLEHTATGMMLPNPPGREVLEGETFRAHFHEQSVLNTIFESQPEAQRRNCSLLQLCLPAELDLETNLITLLADRSAPALGVAQRGDTGPVDAVGPKERPRR